MKVTTDGFADADKALEDMSSGMARGVLRRSLLAAAEPMADLARSMAPDNPQTQGFDLRTSIIAGTRLSRAQTRAHRKMFRDDRASVEAFVGPGPLPQAIQQEFGNVNHPPQPFMRPAFDSDVQPLIGRLGEELKAELEKAAQRAARRTARLARG